MIYVPDSFGNGPRGFLADEHVASEPLQGRMLRDEAEVAMIARMKGAEWDILKRVEIVMARSLIFLKKKKNGTYYWINIENTIILTRDYYSTLLFIII